MTGNGMRQMLQLCEEALNRPIAERDAFLDARCDGQPDLRRDVAALLAEDSDGFLQSPAWTPEKLRLPAGTRLGPYEVHSLIGVGGMGEVYKARDTRLGRMVALKLLPAELAGDGDRRRRFEQEARAVSALNHPHICTLYDVSEHPSTGSGQASLFLVMEYLAGETLAERLAKGALPIAQAVTIGVEITEALAAAHREGIIHRDLKPANVMLTKSGAKLLDFGLAKLTGQGEAAALRLPQGPTRSNPLTGEGVIVGTLQYMAPEQLEGSPADARTDLWAVGAILYEMVTGRRAFEGTSAASVMGAILEREIVPLSRQQPVTPPGLDRLVRRCLAKLPDERPDTAHDLASELRGILELGGAAITSARPTARVWRILRATALVMGGALLTGALGSWLWARSRPLVSPPPVTRSELSIAPAEQVTSTFGPCTPTGGTTRALTWTPDGRSLVFVGRRGNGVRQLYVRDLGAAEARPLAGTEDAQLPVVSADGAWVAFWSPGGLKKVPLLGGPVMKVASVADVPTALLWDGRGRMFFGVAAGGIWQIEPGGAPTELTRLTETERGHIPSSVLPGDRGILYTTRKRLMTWGDEEIVALDLSTAQSKTVLKTAEDARYVPSGHLVFLHLGQLFAVRFDVARLEVEGQPVAVLNGVAQTVNDPNTSRNSGAGQFAIAPGGDLAWIQGPLATIRKSEIVTVDLHGEVTALEAPVEAYGEALRLSRDQRRLAVTKLNIDEFTDLGLWLYDLDRPGRLKPLRRTGEAYWPLWSPDGKHVVFQGLADGRFSLESWSADESAPPDVRATPDWSPSSWTGDGQLLAAGLTDIVVGTFDKGAAGFTRWSQPGEPARWPEMSPDGHWLAYGKNTSGRFEIYVQPYPGRGGAVPVSDGGGTSPVWHPNGRELFYVVMDRTDSDYQQRVMAVDFEPGPRPRIGKPRQLFTVSSDFTFFCFPVRCYDLAPDGKRFYTFKKAPVPPSHVVTHINLVQNWLAELQAKVPVAHGK